MAIQAFTVLSEFRFDVGQAIVGSETLQNSIQGISDHAQSAMNAVKGLGIGMVQNLSGAQAGLLGLFGNAISSSDKFKASQIEIGNAMLSNGMTIGGQAITFKESLIQSSNIMENIIKKSRDFGLDPNELVSQTKFYNNMLAPKGLAGDNLGNASELARVSLKAAPALGVSGDQATSGIMAGISGQLSAATQFGTRLFMEAGDAILDTTGIKNLKEFNAAKPELRVKALIAGLDKLAGSADTVAERANTFSNRLSILKNLFIGVGSVLKPLGDVLIPFINKILDMAIKWISTKGAILVRTMANFLKPFLDDPTKLLVGAQQMSDLGANFKSSVGATGLLLMAMHLKDLFRVLSKVPVVGKVFGFMAEIPILRTLMMGVGGLFKGLWSALAFLWPVLKVVIMGIAEFAVGVGAILIVLQGLSGALARMKIESVAWLADNIASLAQTFASLKHSLSVLFSPIQDMIQGWEEFFFMILGGTWVLDKAKAGFEALAGAMAWGADMFGTVYAGFRGLIAGMFDVIFRFAENLGIIISNLLDGRFTNLTAGTSNIFEGYMAAGAEEFNKTMMRNLAPNGEGGVDNNKTVKNDHNYDVKMTNNFKEVLQPDRIAFTIVDQLKKASTNKTGSKNSSGTAGLLAGANS